MIRAVELSLLLAPVVLYVLWLRFAADGQLAPPRTVLFALVAMLAAVGAGLVWTGLHERHVEGSHYVPAQMEDGRVVPGHAS